uniref:Ribosomal protein eL8/eL30/eS12/Gadd45 domain-containing protein n=1 Tax=Gopherus agassizii TaxID=38772 RepID=A0A452HTL6_9SAUR
MTLEELVACDNTAKKMQTVSEAVEQLLVAAQRQDCLTVGVYESAKLMNVDPDSVVLCLLAIDEEDEGDIALQIHFTLIQAFCCDNDINILRVSGMQRLAKILGESSEDNSEPRDLHCILVTVSPLCCWVQGLPAGEQGGCPSPGSQSHGLYGGVGLCSAADAGLKLAAP